MARTVLLADDSVTAQNMGRRILTDAGYEVITVNNGSAALKKVHENRPDLIVLDVYMPGYGGLEVCQRLKESSDTMRIPILLTVGKMEPFKSDEAKRVRADGHIVKPFEASELLAALTRLEDRIVHQPELARGKKSKSEKKAKSWHAGEDPALAPEEWTDKIAHLAAAKQRVKTEDDPAIVAESASSAPEPKQQEQAVAAPAPEMQVIASTQTDEQQEAGAAPPDITSQFTNDTQNEIQADSESIAAESAEPTLAAIEAVSTDEAPRELNVAPAEIPQEQPESAPVEAVSEEQPAPPAIPESQPELVATASAESSLETVEQPVESSKARWVAENVALSADEAALELDREMRDAQTHAMAMSDTEQAVSTEATGANPIEAATPEMEDQRGATFAAAASASSSAIATGTAHIGSRESISPEAARDDNSESAGPDAAAAWQNWQQIRESVMSAQSTSALAQSVAAAASAVAPESSVSASGSPTEATETDAPPVDGEALASIVDSVLAELKPKLMQEIAKKLKK